MKTITKTAIATAIGLAAAAGAGAGPASAKCPSSLLAQVACETGILSEQEARAAKRFNDEMGRPVHRAAREVGNMVYPGAGDAWYVAQEMRRRGSRLPEPGYGPAPAGGRFGPGGPSYGPPMAMVCATPYGAGPMSNAAPIGVPCTLHTPQGPIPGITQ